MGMIRKGGLEGKRGKAEKIRLNWKGKKNTAVSCFEKFATRSLIEVKNNWPGGDWSAIINNMKN